MPNNFSVSSLSAWLIEKKVFTKQLDTIHRQWDFRRKGQFFHSSQQLSCFESGWRKMLVKIWRFRVMVNNLSACSLSWSEKKIRKFMACDHVTSCNFHRKTKLAENWPNWLREKCYSIDDAKSLVRIRREILKLFSYQLK